MKWSRLLLAGAMAAALGIAVFAVLARQSTSIQDASRSEALLRFDALRDTLSGRQEALVSRADDGQFQASPPVPPKIGQPAPATPRSLEVLAYRAQDERLVEVSVPFWFFRLKEPAVRLMLREADFDWGKLGLSAEQLRRAGAGLVLDERDARGNALLIWLE